MLAAFSHLRTWPRGRNVYTGCTPMCQHHRLLSLPALAQQVVCPSFTYEKMRAWRKLCKSNDVIHEQQCQGPDEGPSDLQIHSSSLQRSSHPSFNLVPPLLPAKTKHVASGLHCTLSFFSQLSHWTSRGFHDAQAKPRAHS